MSDGARTDWNLNPEDGLYYPFIRFTSDQETLGQSRARMIEQAKDSPLSKLEGVPWDVPAKPTPLIDLQNFDKKLAGILASRLTVGSEYCLDWRSDTHTAIRGPLYTLRRQVGDKIELKFWEFQEVVPNEKLQERLAEIKADPSILAPIIEDGWQR